MLQLLCDFLLLALVFIWTLVAKVQEVTQASPFSFPSANSYSLCTDSQTSQCHSEALPSHLKKAVCPYKRQEKCWTKICFKDLVWVLISCRFYLCISDIKADNPKFFKGSSECSPRGSSALSKLLALTKTCGFLNHHVPSCCELRCPQRKHPFKVNSSKLLCPHFHLGMKILLQPVWEAEVISYESASAACLWFLPWGSNSHLLRENGQNPFAAKVVFNHP